MAAPNLYVRHPNLNVGLFLITTKQYIKLLFKLNVTYRTSTSRIFSTKTHAIQLMNQLSFCSQRLSSWYSQYSVLLLNHWHAATATCDLIFSKNVPLLMFTVYLLLVIILCFMILSNVVFIHYHVHITRLLASAKFQFTFMFHIKKKLFNNKYFSILLA